MNSKVSSMLLVLWLLLTVPFSNAMAADVSERYLMSHVRFLTCEALQGRRAAGAGDRITEAYIRAEYERSGILPLPSLGDYRQEFTALETTLDKDSTHLLITHGEQSSRYQIGRDVFYLVNRHSEVSVDAPLVFAGFGITAPEYDYDDYGGIDVEGKIVLVLNNEPGSQTDNDKFRGRAPTRHSFAASKERTAREHGAVGVIIVTDAAAGQPDIDVTMPRRYRRELEQPFFGVRQQAEEIPVLYATRRLVADLLDITHIDLIDMQKRIDASMTPASTAFAAVRAAIHIRLAKVEEKTAANIVGYLEGSDEALREEFIVISAHHDHLGALADGTVF
ncbi:MAG: PA domain-containing protein, partial [Candidatus Latescibacterota bacterium]